MLLIKARCPRRYWIQWSILWYRNSNLRSRGNSIFSIYYLGSWAILSGCLKHVCPDVNEISDPISGCKISSWKYASIQLLGTLLPTMKCESLESQAMRKGHKWLTAGECCHSNAYSHTSSPAFTFTEHRTTLWEINPFMSAFWLLGLSVTCSTSESCSWSSVLGLE